MVRSKGEIKMPKIGHVHLKVSDLEESMRFYTGIFKLKISERVENFVFLSFGKEHHDLALQEHKNAQRPSENMTGLYHFAVELENLKELAKIYFRLRKSRIECSPVEHGISKAIYLEDPDGNGIEIYVDTRKQSGKKKWHGMSRFISEEEFNGYAKN